MHVRARVLLGVLVVVSGLEQAGCPGIVAGRRALGIYIFFTISVGINEPVGVRSGIIDDSNLCDACGIGLDASQQFLGVGVNFALKAFGNVTVAVIIALGVEANCTGVIRLMAAGAGFEVGGQDVSIMAGGAGIQVAFVHEAAQIGLSLILIDTLDLGAEECCARREVVNVAEAICFRRRVEFSIAKSAVD